MQAARATGNTVLSHRAAEWYTVISKQKLGSFAELREQYPDVDRVGDVLVFNLGSYRLIVGFNFRSQRLFFKRLLSHAEYDRGGWKL